jgi:predicted metal-dependent peptidase
MANVMTSFEKARTRMLFRHLFFATIILGTPFIETRKIERAATNMKVVYWNPDFFATLPVDVIMFVLAHEIFHIILKHGLRRGSRDPELWNDACDYAINLQLQDYGFKLWRYTDPKTGKEGGCLIDERFRGMSAERIYAILQAEGKGPDRDGNLPRDLLEPPTDQAERAQIERQIDAAVARAATIARQAGKMPAGMDIIVDGIINPPLPWFALFVNYMTKMRNTEETWSRRNRRITHFVLPSRHNPGMGPVGVIGDTSASMDSYKVWAQVGAELTAMATDLLPEFIQVIWADHQAAAFEERFEQGDLITLHPKGRGGTDMRLPLKHMEQYEPDVCVLITDAETPWPTEPTPFPLLILTTTNQPTPSWADTIRIR